MKIVVSVVVVYGWFKCVVKLGFGFVMEFVEVCGLGLFIYEVFLFLFIGLGLGFLF